MTVALVLACFLSAASPPPQSHASAGNNVVLGAAAFAQPDGEGWGTVKPPRIFNGGDPSGLVTHIRWTHWGATNAIGYGLSPTFKPHGGYYRQLARIELKARALGKCSTNGPPAYTQMLIRAPSHPGGPLGGWTLWAGSKSICKRGF